jgi:hypothetical protein
MPNIANQHCLNHPMREAAALCPECRRFYCRECVTEHDDRVICASCLRKLSKTEEAQGRNTDWVRRAAACGVGVAVAALFFYGLGRELISLPSEFHNESVWKNSAGSDE